MKRNITFLMTQMFVGARMLKLSPIYYLCKKVAAFCDINTHKRNEKFYQIY